MSERKVVAAGFSQVDNNAVMHFPVNNLGWIARYGDIQAVRYTVADCLISYTYLLEECTMKEAVRRLRILRKTARASSEEAGRKEGYEGIERSRTVVVVHSLRREGYRESGLVHELSRCDLAARE